MVRSRHPTPAQVAPAPFYKFVVRVPEGQADKEPRVDVTRDVTQAVIDTEAGRWPVPEKRVRVFTWEVPDGTWGGGQVSDLGDILEFIAPASVDPLAPEWPSVAATRPPPCSQPRASHRSRAAGDDTPADTRLRGRGVLYISQSDTAPSTIVHIPSMDTVGDDARQS